MCPRRFERDTVMAAKGHADQSSGPAEPSIPRQQAVDMTAPETFAKLDETLDKGRRPDRTRAYFPVSGDHVFGSAMPVGRRLFPFCRMRFTLGTGIERYYNKYASVTVIGNSRIRVIQFG